MSDFFRGLITETLQDISTEFGENSATVAVLKAEIEQLKHSHSLELLEIKKNVYSILKDIQKSIAEEQKKLVEDTRSACEVETLKRVHETKLRQWCAMCFKEAQFYCCWNTSYCDYACQQKHWSKHASRCSQDLTNPQAAKAPHVQPVVLRPAPPPNKTNVVSFLLLFKVFNTNYHFQYQSSKDKNLNIFNETVFLFLAFRNHYFPRQQKLFLTPELQILPTR